MASIFREMYFILFKAQLKAMEEMAKGNYEQALLTLREAQRHTEELYMAGDED